MTLRITLSVILLSVAFSYRYAECHYPECRGAFATAIYVMPHSWSQLPICDESFLPKIWSLKADLARGNIFKILNQSICFLQV